MTSSDGNSRSRARRPPVGLRPGFTLVELLVVLTIIATLTALIGPRIASGLQQAALQREARQVAGLLREVRQQAVSSGEELTIRIAADGGSAALFGAADGSALALDVDVTFSPSLPEHLEGAPEIRFFPDGSSSGGRLHLRAGERQLQVAVDWVTGRVSIDGR